MALLGDHAERSQVSVKLGNLLEMDGFEADLPGTGHVLGDVVNKDAGLGRTLGVGHAEFEESV